MQIFIVLFYLPQTGEPYVRIREETQDAAARIERAAGPLDADGGAGEALRQRPSPPGAVPRRPAARTVRPGLFLGRRAQVLGSARRVLDRGGLRRRREQEPDLRGSLHRDDEPHRGGAPRVRPHGRELPNAAEGVLGKPRYHPGHAPGPRPRDAIPLGHLYLWRRAGAVGSSIERAASKTPERK